MVWKRHPRVISMDLIWNFSKIGVQRFEIIKSLNPGPVSALTLNKKSQKAYSQSWMQLLESNVHSVVSAQLDVSLKLPNKTWTHP